MADTRGLGAVVSGGGAVAQAADTVAAVERALSIHLLDLG